MGRFKISIGILTSSRADFGIYTPLIHELVIDPLYQLEIIAFGMHLQEEQGQTLNFIKNENFGVILKTINTDLSEKDVAAISYSYGNLIKDFSLFWRKNKYDLIFALGDRWEMSAAIQASIPFEFKVAHIHGGETTFGAIDNIFRHQITLASKLHFTSCLEHANRVRELTGKSFDIHNIGSLNIHDLESLKLPSWKSIKKSFEIPFDKFILITFHPETINSSQNTRHINELKKILKDLCKIHNLLITKANTDAYGLEYNKMYRELEKDNSSKIRLVSAFGRLNYFKVMSLSEFLIGNSSSALIESASFKKWALNIGIRQNGRLRNNNVIDTRFTYYSVMNGIKKVKNLKTYNGDNIFYKPNSTSLVNDALKAYFNL